MITDLGILLSKIPLDPRCAKILVVASKYDLLHFAIMIVACMSVKELHDEESARNSVLRSIGVDPREKADIDADRDNDDANFDDDLETQLDRDRKREERQAKLKEQKEQRKVVMAEIKK